MAKKARKVVKKRVQQKWTKEHERELKAHSRAKTPVKKISKTMKRTEAALREKARLLGLGLGHRR